MAALLTRPGGRIASRDVAITIVLCLLGILLMGGNASDPKVDMSVPGIPLFLGVTIPLLWRRTAIVAAVLASFAALLVHDLLFGADPIRCGVVLPTTFLFAFAAGSLLEEHEARIALAVSMLPILAETITFFKAFGVVFLGLNAAMWGIGRVTRSRTLMADELAVRTAELRAARDERARLEVAADRARLSGELDELLRARLAALARLADAGARPGDATATLVDIERESRRTLEQMRELVGVLRDEDGDAPLAPQPTLTHLEAMLVRAKGTDAHLTVEGSPRVLPPGVELSAYRIVEYLLDALEDAPGVDVRVRFRDDALELIVAGPAKRRSKEAIARARERVELQRGTLQSHRHGGRSEALVSLPLLTGG